MADAISMSNEEKRLVTASPMTAGGQPAPIDGEVAFAVTGGDCTIAEVDATSAYVVSGATIGDSTVTMTCDADLGAGIVTVSDSMLVHVLSATAQSLEISVGPPGYFNGKQ